MRWLLLTVLVAVPVSLVAWVSWARVHDAPPEFVPPEAPKSEDPEPALRKLFEGNLGGLVVKGEPNVFDEKSLFDAIDGAAPTFIERRFRRSIMTDVEHADSIFQKEKSNQAKTPADWPEALTGPMSLVFHQGRFYVKLIGFDAEAEAALPLVGRALKEKMK